MELELRLSPNKNWGLKRNGKVVSSYYNSGVTFQVGLGPNGNYHTGLEGDEEKDILRKTLEKDLIYKEGTLSSANESFWANFNIRIDAEEGDDDDGPCKILDDSVALDRLKIAVLKADPTVANSKEEVSRKHDFYLTTKNAEAKAANKTRSIMAQTFIKEASLSADEVVSVLAFYKITADAAEPERTREKLSEQIDINPEKFLALVEDKDFELKTLIVKCINCGVIEKQGSGRAGYNVPLYFGDNLLGKGISEAAELLSKQENKNILDGVKKLYNIEKKK